MTRMITALPGVRNEKDNNMQNINMRTLFIWDHLKWRKKENANLCPNLLDFSRNKKRRISRRLKFRVIYRPFIFWDILQETSGYYVPFPPLPSRTILASHPGYICYGKQGLEYFCSHMEFFLRIKTLLVKWLWSAVAKADFWSITRKVLLNQFHHCCWCVKKLYLLFTSRTFDLRLKTAASRMVPEKERYKLLKRNRKIENKLISYPVYNLFF